MSRFTSLPLAIRIAAALGLQAVALLLVTTIALNSFGTFRREVRTLSDHDVRAVSVAGVIGQHIQAIGRMTTDHLYVYDGDLKAQDALARKIAKLGNPDRA